MRLSRERRKQLTQVRHRLAPTGVYELYPSLSPAYPAISTKCQSFPLSQMTLTSGWSDGYFIGRRGSYLVLCQQGFNGVLVPPGSSLVRRSRAPMSNLTISLLISRDVDCSGDICCNDINEYSGAVWFPLTASCPRVEPDPACPLGPEVP